MKISIDFNGAQTIDKQPRNWMSLFRNVWVGWFISMRCDLFELKRTINGVVAHLSDYKFNSVWITVLRMIKFRQIACLPRYIVSFRLEKGIHFNGLHLNTNESKPFRYCKTEFVLYSVPLITIQSCTFQTTSIFDSISMCDFVAFMGSKIHAFWLQHVFTVADFWFK